MLSGPSVYQVPARLQSLFLIGSFPGIGFDVGVDITAKNVDLGFHLLLLFI